MLRLLEETPDLPPPKLFLGLYGMTNIASSFYNVYKDYEQSVSKDTSQRRMADVVHLFDPSRAPVMGTDVKWFRTTIDSANTDEEREAYDQTNLYFEQTSDLYVDRLTCHLFPSGLGRCSTTELPPIL